MRELLEKAAEKSVTLVRDVDGILPLKLEKGAKVLAITLSPSPKDHPEDDFPAFADALSERGYEVIRMTNPSHYRVNEVINDVEAVFVTSVIDTTNCTGNSLRLGWNNMMTFWRGYIFKNKNLVFISLGDPYKLTELPFLKCYINSYIKSGAAIDASVAACLGEKKIVGKSPVKLN
jgi:beta-N-acetylhexosaminidase